MIFISIETHLATSPHNNLSSQYNTIINFTGDSAPIMTRL